MKAVTYESVGNIALKDVEEPKLIDDTDAIVKITTSAICGTDLHMVRGMMGNMLSGTIMGHEGVGVVEQVGPHVRNFRPGDHVVIPSTIACGYCVYCRAGYYSQCDNANPNGKEAGTAFYGGPKTTGPFNGLQAEKARVPFANVGMVKLPEWISEDQAIMLSDILPTAFFGAEMAEITRGDVVAIFGCGPVGLMAIQCAFLKGAGRIFAIDAIPDRLDRAQFLGAEIINFANEDPVKTIHELTGGVGADRVIDAVGIDAELPQKIVQETEKAEMYSDELNHIRKAGTLSEEWEHGNAPSAVLEWAVDALDKAGTLSIIGVYPETMRTFPIGKAMNKNLRINLGNCNHRKYIPYMMSLVHEGNFILSNVISQAIPFSEAINAYREFDRKKSGWVKVALKT
jgi:threonine dehydrogenase-like Zn-dependent dehydrogenase